MFIFVFHVLRQKIFTQKWCVKGEPVTDEVYLKVSYICPYQLGKYNEDSAHMEGLQMKSTILYTYNTIRVIFCEELSTMWDLLAFG